MKTVKTDLSVGIVAVRDHVTNGSGEDGIGAGLSRFQRLFNTSSPVGAVVASNGVVLVSLSSLERQTHQQQRQKEHDHRLHDEYFKPRTPMRTEPLVKHASAPIVAESPPQRKGKPRTPK